ncbi:MAG: beta strand repeat-containing protein [Pirellulaceae bacterium]
MFPFTRLFKKTALRKHLDKAEKRGKLRALLFERFEERVVLTGGAYAPSVFSDLPDYAPGSTAIISAKNFTVGSTVQFQVSHVIDAGVDEVFGTLDDTLGDNSGSGHEPWTVTDGGAGDLDNLANGDIRTTWYVNPDDSLDATFLVTAIGIDVGADGIAGTADDSLTGEVASNSFTDSGGAYSLKWIAADPALDKAPYLPTYSKITPEMWLAAHGGIYPGTTTAGGPVTTGRAADPLANAVVYASPFQPSNQDAVTSLAPKDMALGQIVPFFIEIKTSGVTTPENGVIQFTTNWLGKTTSGSDFGFDINYGVIAAFVDTADPGTIEVGTPNAKVDSFTWTVLNPGTNNELIQGAFNVSGLSTGETTVVEIWVVLDKTITAGITGNVQTGLVSAKTANNDTINTGNQTVPLLQVGDFFTSDVDLAVIKSDNPASVTAVDDAANTLIGSQLTYTIQVDANHLFNNNGDDITSVANGVVVYDVLDPNTSYVSYVGGSASNGGFINSDSTDAIPNGAIQWNLGALVPGASQILTYTVTVLSTAPTATTQDLANTVFVTTISDDKVSTNNNNVEHTDVLDARWSISAIQTISEPAITRDSTGNYTISLAGASLASGQTATMTLDAMSSTATEGLDFETFLSNLTGLQGVTVNYNDTTKLLSITNNSGIAKTGDLVSFEINALSDTVNELNETFTTAISAPSLGLLGTGSVTTTITDATTAAITLSGPAAVIEGELTTPYIVTLNGVSIAAGASVSFTLDTSSGTATEGADFTALSAANLTSGLSFTTSQGDNGTINVTVTNNSGSTVASGSILVQFALPTTDDAIVEGTEGFTVTLSSTTATVTVGTVTTTIIDNDINTVSLSASTVVEGAIANYTFTATLSNPSQGVTTIVTNQGTITIANGATTGTLVIASGNTEDVYLDPSSLTATITSATGGNFETLLVSVPSATAYVTDTINTTTLKLSGVTSFQGNTFIATLSNPSQGVTTIVTNQGTIIIANGATTGTLLVQASGPGLTATITSTSGGNFEKLVIGTACATAYEVVRSGQAATVEFWASNNGQTLLSSYASTALGTWLGRTYPNLFGNLNGATGTQVAAYFLIVKAAMSGSNWNTYGQSLATALGVWVTTSGLGWSTSATGPTTYGFLQGFGGAGLGEIYYNVGSNGAAFGVANNTLMKVKNLSSHFNSKCVRTGGSYTALPTSIVFYGNNATSLSRANNVFNGINNIGGIV